jgi:hypothetical protein
MLMRILLTCVFVSFATTAAEAKAKKKRPRAAAASSAPRIDEDGVVRGLVNEAEAPEPAAKPEATTPAAVFEHLPPRPAPAPLEEPKPLGLQLGATVHGGGSFGGPQAASVGGTLELGYRAPFLRRMLGFSAAASVSKVFLPSVNGANGYGVALTPMLSFYLQKDRDIGRLQLGPSLRYTSVALNSTIASSVDSTWGMGAVANLSYLRVLGKGGPTSQALGVTASYAASPYFANNKLYVGHMIGLGLAYAFEL